MPKNFSRLLVSMLFIILTTNSLFSSSLENILQQAAAHSPQMQRYELNKKNTELAVSISDTDDQLGIEVTTGNVTAQYDPIKNAYVFNTSGIEAAFTLPDDGKTTLTVGTGAVAYTPSGNMYSLAPKVSATHTITYGETGDNRSTLLSRQNLMLAGFTYENNVVSFENSVYNQIIALLNNEKSQKASEKQLADLQKEIDDALSLKTLSKESLFLSEPDECSAESEKFSCQSQQQPFAADAAVHVAYRTHLGGGLFHSCTEACLYNQSKRQYQCIAQIFGFRSCLRRSEDRQGSFYQ